MFDILKNKIKGFTDKLKQKIGAEPQAEKVQAEEKQADAEIIEKSPLPEETFAEEPIEEKPAELEEPESLEKPAAEPAKETQKITEVQKNGSIDLEKLKVDDKREIKASVSATSQLKSFFSSHIVISEKDIDELLYDFELALLESDVDQDTATFLCEKIKKELVGKKIPKGKEFDNFIKQEIKNVFA